MRRFLFAHFKPTTTLVLSFAFLILSGTLLLALPISNTTSVPLIDHLFTATTSTCVTGLVTVVVADQYTVFGQFVVLALIQLGGLGLMTVISVILLFMHNKLELKERLLLKDALNKMDFSNISAFIKGIIRFTLFFEGIGALLLMLVFIPQYGLVRGIWYSVFISISAFCNAGIDNIGPLSLLPYQNNPIVVLTVACLIIFGGLGFTVWFDIKNNLGILYNFRKKLKKLRLKFQMHSKIVIYVTIGLLLSGTILIFLIEYNNSLAGLSFPSKVMNAFFQSTTLRTAGFFTIDITIIHRITRLIMVIYMLIGGSPGGTAGGIKTTTFFLLCLMTITQIKKRDEMRTFKRHIPKSNFIGAFIIFAGYLFAVLLAWLIMLCTEGFDPLDILFEIASAIGTVGLTVGITPSLSFIGKCVIILLMFIGRVGPITVAYAMGRKHKKDVELKYPNAEIIVG